MTWERMKAGWYIADLGDGCSGGIGICLEADRRWHVYIKRESPPGDASCTTLAEAKKWAERRAGK